MDIRKCPPGQVARFGQCVPRLPSARAFSSLPSANTPSGGFSPFSNSASSRETPTSPPQVPTVTPESPFDFEFSGTVTGGTSVDLDFPFDKFRAPFTAEVRYSLNPDTATFRGPTEQGFFSILVQSQITGVGVELSWGYPDIFQVRIYYNFRPAPPPEDPSQSLADVAIYETTWPPGTPITRVTVDENLVPTVYFDGVPAVLTGPTIVLDNLVDQSANVSASNIGPGPISVNIEDMRMVGRFIPPPAPLTV